MGEHRAFRVQVRHNVIHRLDPVSGGSGIVTANTKLEISTQLARNHQERGCIDGDYFFDDLDTAKYFAYLCQDFVGKIIERTVGELMRLRSVSDEMWRNPYVLSLDNNSSCEENEERPLEFAASVWRRDDIR